jgi:hypothetical protein
LGEFVALEDGEVPRALREQAMPVTSSILCVPAVLRYYTCTEAIDAPFQALRNLKLE